VITLVDRYVNEKDYRRKNKAIYNEGNRYIFCLATT
jgi:hypothetical protein